MSGASIALTKERLFTSNFVLACLLTLASFLSFYFLMATMPPFVLDIGGSETDVGLVMGAFAIVCVVVRPLVGLGSDRWGPKRLIVVGSLLMSAAPVLYMLAGAVPTLLVVRLLHGIGWALAGTACMALIAEIAPATRRGEAVGFFGMFSNAAMAVGPATGMYVLRASSFPVLFMVCSAVAVLSFLLSFAVREPSRMKSSADEQQTETRIVEPRAVFPSAVMGLLTLTYGAIITFLPLYAVLRGIDNPGLFFTAYAIVVIMVRSFAGRLSDRYGRAAAIVPGLLMAAMGLGVLTLAADMTMFLVVAVLYGFGFALVQPALTAFAIDRVDPRSRGAAMGTFSAAIDLGIGGGSVVWGFLVHSSGYQALYLICMGVAVLAATLFLAGSRHQTAKHPV